MRHGRILSRPREGGGGVPWLVPSRQSRAHPPPRPRPATAGGHRCCGITAVAKTGCLAAPLPHRSGLTAYGATAHSEPDGPARTPTRRLGSFAMTVGCRGSPVLADPHSPLMSSSSGRAPEVARSRRPPLVFYHAELWSGAGGRPFRTNPHSSSMPSRSYRGAAVCCATRRLRVQALPILATSARVGRPAPLRYAVTVLSRCRRL